MKSYCGLVLRILLMDISQIIIAWLDKDNRVAPLTDEQLNPVWKILNYETGKYDSVQKHFRVFEA